MLNKSILMGRLTRDPELRYTQSNVPVVSFTLAVDRVYKKDNDAVNCDFIDIVAWRGTAEFVSKWFRKGQLVAVSGRIQTKNWKDKDGNNRTAVEVVADEVFFAESKKDNREPVSPVTENNDSDANDFEAGDSDFKYANFEELCEDGELPF